MWVAKISSFSHVVTVILIEINMGHMYATEHVNKQRWFRKLYAKYVLNSTLDVRQSK